MPRPGHKATGEERAWGRRLAKRFGVDGDYDDRAFVGHGRRRRPVRARPREPEARRPSTPRWSALFDGLDAARGDALIAFGWAMAEDLAKLA